MYSMTQERRHLQLGRRRSTKGSAANVVSMGIHLTIVPTTNQAGSSRKTKVTTCQEVLLINLPETGKHPTRSATGAEDTVRAGMQEQAAARALSQQAKGAREYSH